MRRTGAESALPRAVRTVLGIAAAVLWLACEGAATPTEVVAVEPEATVADVATTISSGGPGCVEGCVPGATFVTVDAEGALREFVPDRSACTTKIVHERRTMTIELVLPPEMRPTRNVTLDFESTGWECPMPGPTWEPVCTTRDWSVRVQPSGRYRGTCHIHDF